MLVGHICLLTKLFPSLSFLFCTRGAVIPPQRQQDSDWTVSVQQVWFLPFTSGRVTILFFLAEAFPLSVKEPPHPVWPAVQLQDSLVIVKGVLGSQVGAHRWTVLGAFADDPGLTVEADLSRESMGWDLHKAT